VSLSSGAGLPDALTFADGLAARGELERAAGVLEEGLLAEPGSLELRERLADVRARRGEVAESLRLLDDVATDCARSGMPGRAIAALKKIARIDPAALPEAGRRIAALARQRELECPGHAARAAARHESPADGRGLSPSARGTGPDAALPASRSELFGDFSTDELAAVIHGLDLRSFAPGDLVVSQGEPGRSLFVVASGSVKVWVQEGHGRARFVRTLGEGDFFGEVSLLTGRPRTATVTAAAPSDLLELDWSRVEEIVRDHPRVADVLRAFCDERLRADLSAREGARREEGAGPADSA
jgi:cAMP-dependent protein kinase regulator